MKITKADGTREEFKPAKLISSLRKAGASQEEVERIVRRIEQSLTEGMQTQKIYQQAFKLLRDSGDAVAAKYSLRRAVFGLGPTGFPFEDFLGKIFEAEGYTTKRRITLRGKCAIHEIDLAAYSPNHSFIAEAKFHSHPGVKSDLQVALYSYARYLDLQSARICEDDSCGIVSLCLVTNTKFTTTAIKYAECVGIDMLSWNYPHHNSLHDKIQSLKLYPITVLSNLSTAQKQQLLTSGVILCREILRSPRVLFSVGLSSKKTGLVLQEIASLCGSK